MGDGEWIGVGRVRLMVCRMLGEESFIGEMRLVGLKGRWYIGCMERCIAAAWTDWLEMGFVVLECPRGFSKNSSGFFPGFGWR